MLVHRMVKNVKDSKVLEKIRTRDARNLADLQDVNYKGYLISVTYDGWFFVQTKSASGGWKPIPNAKFGNIDQAKAFIDSHPVKDSKTKDKDYMAEIYYDTRYGYDKDHVNFTAGSDSEAMSKVRSFKLKKKDQVVVHEKIYDNPKDKSSFDTREVGTFTKDMKVTITIEGEDVVLPNEPLGVSKPAEPAPKELIPFEGENYKGFDIKQDEETGAFDVYSTGGALVAHTETLELAKSFIDNVDVGV